MNIQIFSTYKKFYDFVEENKKYLFLNESVHLLRLFNTHSHMTNIVYALCTLLYK